AQVLRDQGHIVEALQDPALLNTATLDHYDVLVLTLPDELFTVNEKADIAQFVVQGGRLVTIAENGQYPGDYRDILNDLHTYLGDGLVHNKDVIEDPTDNKGGIARRPIIHSFSTNAVNSGVGTVLEIYGSSLQVGSAFDGTAFGDNDTTAVIVTSTGISGDVRDNQDYSTNEPHLLADSQVDGFLVVQALAPVGAGDVFAIGDANLWDDSDLDANGVTNLYEYDNAQLAANVFAFGKECGKCRWALFKDRDPWPQAALQGYTSPTQELIAGYPMDSTGQFSLPNLNPDLELQFSRGELFTSTAASLAWLDPNEQIMQDWGIPYTIFRSGDIAAVDLEQYCKAIVASMQPLAFYQAMSANRTWFETWIGAGGILEIHGAPLLSDDWSGLPMPGGFSMSYYTTNLVSINNAEHLLFKRPHLITDAEVENWGFSTHGYLVDLPTGTLELVNHDEEGQPAAIKFKFGQGCVLATQQTLEWGWDTENSPMLDNYLRYDNCHGDYHLYLSLAMNGQP
ncbi:MAG: DUF4350 domain-containing protein, partial [Anaerolineales bacterium]